MMVQKSSGARRVIIAALVLASMLLPVFAAYAVPFDAGRIEGKVNLQNRDDLTDYIRTSDNGLNGTGYSFRIPGRDESAVGAVYVYDGYMYVYGYRYTGEGNASPFDRTNWVRQTEVTGWGCAAMNKTLASYPDPLCFIDTMPVTCYAHCYDGCRSMTEAPRMSGTAKDTDFMFRDCTSLRKAYVQGPRALGRQAFGGCTSLKYVYLSSTIETVTAGKVSDSPFYGAGSGAVICCEASSAQPGWGSFWRYAGPSKLAVEYDADAYIFTLY